LRRKLLFFLAGLISFIQTGVSQNIERVSAQADSLFAAGRFEAAYPLYRQELRQQQRFSARSLLRMAYVQEGLGHYPAALYYLNLAQSRQPRLATWQKITELAQAHRLTGYSTTWRQSLLIPFRRYYYRGLQGLLLLAVLGGVLLLTRRSAARTWWVSYATYLALVGLYLNLLQPSRVGLVARPRAALMAGPSAAAAWLTTATAGDRLLVQGQRDIWYQVQWRGQQAYIRRNDLLLIP
jgi:tetratricopeptide (TPR) repeat protein